VIGCIDILAQASIARLFSQQSPAFRFFDAKEDFLFLNFVEIAKFLFCQLDYFGNAFSVGLGSHGRLADVIIDRMS
jgi:hypothetical protein